MCVSETKQRKAVLNLVEITTSAISEWTPFLSIVLQIEIKCFLNQRDKTVLVKLKADIEEKRTLIAMTVEEGEESAQKD